MTNESFRRACAGVLACLLVALVALGTSCGDSDSTKPNGNSSGELLPDFCLLDVNPHSSSYEHDVSLGSFADSIVMIYFGEVGCDDCLDELMGIRMVIDSLESEGLAGLAGMMINPNRAAPYASDILEYSDHSGLPVLQDTLKDGHDAVAQLLECEEGAEFLVVDREQYLRKKTRAGPVGPMEIDLRTSDGQKLLMDWIRQIDTTSVHTGLAGYR